MHNEDSFRFRFLKFQHYLEISSGTHPPTRILRFEAIDPHPSEHSHSNNFLHDELRTTRYEHYAGKSYDAFNTYSSLIQCF